MNWMRRFFLGSVFAVCASNFGQNLLENGSFEFSSQDPADSVRLLNAGSNGLENWVIGGSGVTYCGTLLNAADGQRSVHLNRIAPGWVEQMIVTAPGVQYRVNFDVSAYVYDGRYAQVMNGKATVTSASSTVLVTKAFSHDGTGKTFPDAGWTHWVFDFTADSTNATIRFESTQSGGVGPIVDNIIVAPGHEIGGEWVSDSQLVWKTRMPRQSETTIGATYMFAPEVLGAGPVEYQWYKRTGNSYNAISGATSATYTLGPIASNSGAIFRVVATNEFGAITNETTLVVVTPPRFAKQPEEQRVTVGQQFSLNPSFSGSAPSRAQWYKNGEPILGATNNYYTKVAALDDAGDYFVTIFNLAGETNSVTVPVQVLSGPVPPWFRPTFQPNRNNQNLNVEEGSSLFISGTAEGGQPISYFWLKNDQPLPGETSSILSKNGAEVTAEWTGTYSLLASNSVGTATSSNISIFVYPPQQYPLFVYPGFQTNASAGAPFALKFELSQGTFLNFQWYKRAVNESFDVRHIIPGETSQTLNFPNLTLNDAAYYYLVATNFKGSAEASLLLNVVSPPVFSSAPGGYEGPESGSVQMSANLINWSGTTTYKWYRNGELIPNATLQTYSFSASAAAAGTYTVVAKNEAGETTSPPATVTIRALTPAEGEWLLVADNTVSIPDRGSLKFNTVGDATLEDEVVTFQGVIDFNDVGGLYRWTAPNQIGKIVDLTTQLPTFSGLTTNYDGVSQEDGGKVAFIAGQPDNADHGVFEWQNGTYSAVATHARDMPGRPGLKFGRFGYTSRGGGKTAFLGMETVTAGYRGVFVWDGTTLSAWASSDQPLPGGSGVWTGNSSQIGFDGTTAAFWAVDSNNEDGVFKTVNGAPLTKIAFRGDAIPGGLGTFKSFNSPPRVTDGKVLFMAQANEFSGNMLLEHSALGLRVIAKTGDSPVGGGPFTILNYNFRHGAGADILFSAGGPGQKQGIYKWNNGTITEVLTTLNTLNGRAMRFLNLYDADGKDMVVGLSFNGSQFALYANVGNNGPSGPEISFAVNGSNITLTWGPGSTLQESTDLTTWTDVQDATSPKIVSATDGIIRFYRLVQ